MKSGDNGEIRDMSQLRTDVLPNNTWNVNALYGNWDVWDKEYAELCQSQSGQKVWPQLEALRHTFAKKGENVKLALDLYFSLDRIISKLYTYAHLRHDEDITHDLHKQKFQKISSLYHLFAQESSWIQPELLTLSKQTLEDYIKDPLLKEYKFYLEKVCHLKEHSLSAEKEELVALAAQPLDAIRKSFSALNNADLNLGTVTDAQNQELPLTHAAYQGYIRSQDRTLRKNSFQTLHAKYLEKENTFCELFQGQLQAYNFYAKSHHYKSNLESALFPKNIDTKVYTNLIATVRKGLSALHSYYNLRKKILNLPELHLYDMYVALLPELDVKVDYDKAVQWIIESVAPLGNEYQSRLEKGLMQEGWVDRYENKFKRTGAYSSGCYDSYPYILMNFTGELNDAFTLAHEAGHSMHSALSWQNQPYQYSEYTIFVAEVASTFNEELLLQHLLKQSHDPLKKAYLINHKLEEIRGTLFRQTMFAEFELKMHTLIEQREPLTPQKVKDIYIQLNRDYFGDSVVVDEEISIEWARIPHFYSPFYVYQYATGVSAALTLADKVLQGGEKERQLYLNFLKSGGSLYPLEQLQIAGADLISPHPVENVINKFNDLVKEMEKILI
ncbi:MAG: yjbG [Chlamydiales bacterium]|jgi:oligoendopeptidase F|nr:yjbG [Chlamydiales bacterium]